MGVAMYDIQRDVAQMNARTHETAAIAATLCSASTSTKPTAAPKTTGISCNRSSVGTP
jgi:hypothetical protein